MDAFKKLIEHIILFEIFNTSKPLPPPPKKKGDKINILGETNENVKIEFDIRNSKVWMVEIPKKFLNLPTE